MRKLALAVSGRIGSLLGALICLCVCAAPAPSARAAQMDPAFEAAARALSALPRDPRFASAYFRAVSEFKPFPLEGPAAARVIFADSYCYVEVIEGAQNSPFMANLREATGWSDETAALYVLAHEREHCDSFQKLRLAMKNQGEEQSRLALKALLPNAQWLAEEPAQSWRGYESRFTDPKATLLREAAADVKALMLMSCLAGMKEREISALATMRNAQAKGPKESRDPAHNTAPWLRGLASDWERLSKSCQGEPLEFDRDYLTLVDQRKPAFFDALPWSWEPR